MTDRELLELAAKAVGICHEEIYFPGKGLRLGERSNGYTSWIVWWNPLDDDGDALRLAVMLGVNVYTSSGVIMAEVIHSGDLPSIVSKQPWKGKDGKVVATRRAIVSAAAEIGKNMKEGK